MSYLELLAPRWIFCIDTDQYAGNFEREMVAYCTGEVGECGVGGKKADEFCKEVDGKPFRDNKWDASVLDQVPDDNGCDRPAMIWRTPGWLNDGRGTHKRVAEVAALEGVAAEPWKHCDIAYNSVAVAFNEVPIIAQLDLLRERALRFTEKYGAGFQALSDENRITIEGFRLIRWQATHEVCGEWNMEADNA